jgi:uncharacterized membrane protein
MLSNLPRRIALWQQQGLIDEATAARLIEFENNQNSRSWVVFGIAGVGITALLAGIISVVAANWADIPSQIKIASYFALQIVAGLVFVRNEAKPGLVREASLTVFALLFWAGIALFAQLYNLVGESWQSILLWSALAFPAALYAESKLLCSLWCITLLYGVGSWTEISVIHASVLHDDGEPFRRACVALSVPVLLTALSILGRHVGIVRTQLFNAGVFWGIGALLPVLTPLANIAWCHSEGLPAGANPAYLLIPWGAVAFAITVSLSRAQVSATTRTATSLLFLSLAAYATVPALVATKEYFPDTLGQILGALGFLIVWTIAAAAAALGSLKRLYDVATAIIAIRFIVIYFEVFGSLSYTGIGLIISGVVIITVAVYWNRLRQIFLRTVEGRN